MRITTNREVLLPVLAKVGGVVERRQTLPILGNLLLVARGESLQITGTDLELEIRAITKVTIDAEGETTLPARKVMDICRALPEGVEIALNVEKDRASLVAGKSRFTLSILPASDFPTMETIGGTVSLEVEGKTLRYLFEMTAFAMGNQDVRYYLNGLLLEVRSDGIVTVATDGHRLARVEESLELGSESELQIILPRKTVLEVNRLLAGYLVEKVRLEMSDKFIRINLGDVTVTSKLIDGRYPDYQRVIPPASERVAYADREALKQALLRTAILSNEKYRGVKFSLKGGQLKLQAHNPEQEEAEEELEISYAQEPTVMGFNVGYLIDVLNVLGDEEVEIGFKDSDSSAIIRNRGKANETFVVMPMRL